MPLYFHLQDDRDTKVVVFKSLHESFFLAHLNLNVINGTQGGQAGSIEFNHMIENIKAMETSLCRGSWWRSSWGR